MLDSRGGGSAIGVATAPSAGRLLQLGDQLVGLGAGELARRLALGEAHRTTGITEVGMTGGAQQVEQLLHLTGRGRRA